MNDPSRITTGFFTGDSGDGRVRPVPWMAGDSIGGGGGSGSGSQGSQGSQGFQGFQGNVGSQGNIGGQGAQGSQGAPGAQGADGAQGSSGGIGAQGAQGDKGAILYGRSQKEIVRVVCPELPETWLFDIVKCGDSVDPIFLSVIELDTLRAIGPGVSIMNGIVLSGNPDDKILIGGIRKGFLGKRFVRQTPEQMEHSRKFWSEQFA